MDQRLRQQYLEAMGIQTWALRGDDEAVEAATAPPEEQTTVSQKPSQERPQKVPQPAAATAEPSDMPSWMDDVPDFDDDFVPAEESSDGELDPPTNLPGGRDEIARLDWKGLEQRVAECERCELHRTRSNTVFGVGSREADLLVIGEAPGAEEDKQGEPFVGRAGQLLNAMLRAIGLKREQVFIANILKCRPPNNRDPRPEEAAHCEPYLERQLALVKPKVILCVGRVAAQNLLNSQENVGRMRGRIHAYNGTPVVVSYHPAYLLRSPDQKGKAWDDLQVVAKRLMG